MRVEAKWQRKDSFGYMRARGARNRFNKGKDKYFEAKGQSFQKAKARDFKANTPIILL